MLYIESHRNFFIVCSACNALLTLSNYQHVTIKDQSEKKPVICTCLQTRFRSTQRVHNPKKGNNLLRYKKEQ